MAREPRHARQSDAVGQAPLSPVRPARQPGDRITASVGCKVTLRSRTRLAGDGAVVLFRQDAWVVAWSKSSDNPRSQRERQYPVPSRLRGGRAHPGTGGRLGFASADGSARGGSRSTGFARCPARSLVACRACSRPAVCDRVSSGPHGLAVPMGRRVGAERGRQWASRRALPVVRPKTGMKATKTLSRRTSSANRICAVPRSRLRVPITDAVRTIPSGSAVRPALAGRLVIAKCRLIPGFRGHP
jgi:hypothetical protein